MEGISVHQCPLQFGHGFTAVENSPAPVGAGRICMASIRPRLHRRGKLGIFSRAIPREFGASIRPRLHRRGKLAGQGEQAGAGAELQFGHGFTAVENERFLMSDIYAISASIRPRLHRRGKRRRRRSILAREHPSFNSATASPPWKTQEMGGPKPVSKGLQFGHGFTAVENTVPGIITSNKSEASIRPRLHRRGKPYYCSEYQTRARCFNSATASPPWKTSTGSTARVAARRGFNSATASPPWKTAPHGRPGYGRIEASIRPRLHRRGKPGNGYAYILRDKLQFGHGFTAVENRAAHSRFAPRLALQFGHGFTAVENFRWLSVSQSPRTASIRPRLHRRGKQG